MTMNKLLIPCMALCLGMLAACSSSQPSATGPNASTGSTLQNVVDRALDRANHELRTENITVSHNDPTLPKAELTPQGDFIVGGKTVPITPAQRSALLEYRSRMIDVAAAGIAIGKQGANIGIQAAGDAIAAALSGKSDADIKASVKAKTQAIREAAVKLCDRLPEMLTEQQKLATALPTFKPYATMTEKDISDCRADALRDSGND